MLKNILRITLIGYIWSRYKTAVISTTGLIVYFWLVGKIHEDYVNYGQLSENTGYIGVSFVVKWLAILAGIAAYIALNVFRFNKAGIAKKGETNSSNSHSDFKTDKSESSNRIRENDPFESIRTKDKLKSKADFIIEKSNK